MAFNGEKALTEESLLEKASPFVQLIALFGIPAAVWVALVQAPQIPRFMNGLLAPLFVVVEVGSLLTVLVLVFALRACLALPSAPLGFYRNVLDFLAMARWHPAVKVALAGLIVVPPVFYLRPGNYWLVERAWTMGRRALSSGDIQDGLEGIGVMYEFALAAGVPLLFALHLLSRRERRSRVLLWVLVPLLFVGTAIAFVVLVTIMHFA